MRFKTRAGHPFEVKDCIVLNLDSMPRITRVLGSREKCPLRGGPMGHSRPSTRVRRAHRGSLCYLVPDAGGNHHLGDRRLVTTSPEEVVEGADAVDSRAELSLC